MTLREFHRAQGLSPSRRGAALPVGTAPDDPLLVVSSEVTDEGFVLSVRGVLVRGSVIALEAQIDQMAYANPRIVLLEATDLVRIDATGIEALVGIAQYVQALGGVLKIIGAVGELADVLATTISAAGGSADISAQFGLGRRAIDGSCVSVG
jgi:anti-anti-sigma regulatory factor